ncbi:pimeloyl-ACP methyl esterase BioG family protein [Phaeobacter sp. C3_T13_0]|uniref:pimeloyl-ACP methyl esterase BioG family protein n=1 Tax=Phaeobacter cretensis TaxID=3342641 RepID=UPI0039BC22BE
MDIRWLKRNNAADVIVVFGGWAIGPEVFPHLDGLQDVVFVNDYTEIDAELPDLSGYREVSLLAWSFGVASYGHWQAGRDDPFHRKVAVNGTLTPVDDALGIPVQVMEKTAETLSSASFSQFLRRAFNARQAPIDIDVTARRAELQAVAMRGAGPDTDFDLVWISAQDRIFPAENQRRAWAGQTVREREAPHAPFATFSTWQEVLT